MNFSYLIDNTFSLKSTTTKKLKNKEIKRILFLKNTQWKFGIKLQIKWFKENIKKNDIHNLFYIKTKLIGYTSLRKRTCEFKNSNKKTKYLLFDTLIIDKKYQGMKMSNILMSFNNMIIKKSGFFSFLVCSDMLVSYYRKYNWKKLNKRFFHKKDYTSSSNVMIFNKLDLNKKLIFIFH